MSRPRPRPRLRPPASWRHRFLGGLVCVITGEHRTGFVPLGESAHRFLEQCVRCWCTWDEAGQAVR